MHALYRALLFAMPADVRREFGDDMLQLFRDHERGISAHPARVLAFWIAAFGDLIWQGLGERARRVSSRFGRREHMRHPMRSFLQDFRHGVRLLAQQRAFTAVAVIVLALGIGANTAVTTIVNGLLIKPLVGHPGGELAQLFSKDTVKPDTYRAFSYPNYLDLRAHADVFASLTAHSFSMAGVDDGSGRGVRQAFIDVTTGNLFETFGVPLLLGRTFTADEERPGVNVPVAVLSYPTWQRLGSPGDIIGHTIRVNARPFTVVGVAPRGFG